MIEGVILEKKKIIETDGGSVFKGIKDQKGLIKEVYFSTISKDTVRAWKKHTLMTLNLLVPIGSVKFILVDDREKSKSYRNFQEIVLSSEQYFLLKVPPGIWFGMRGLSEGISLICNTANFFHDESEVVRLEYKKLPARYRKL
ncbi:MAG: dTDP-4-dehydrorhamnose 3,5-epimerase [Gammaproteobacteria bacterium]|nr:dTDP-4-dehydrorhamnose 3,5-epimerase [Gammaproteobacteria bacterium]|tara:strand:- start:9 stop:437 length:429 start_codon:yes stop_codon:yes gene_type:complete